MAVPVSGNFNMFGTGSTTSIAGAMHDTGDNVNGIDTFNGLISAANAGKFDFTYAGEIQSPDLDVSSSRQFRGYPVDPAICRAVWVDDAVDSSRYGLRYTLASNQVKDTTFSSLFGSPGDYGGNSGIVYNVCSQQTPSVWDSSNNTLVNLGSQVVNFADGGDCYVNTDCIWTATETPTPTPTNTPIPATDTPTPTPTPIPATDTPTPTPVPTQLIVVQQCYTTNPYEYVRLVGTSGVPQGFVLELDSAGDTLDGICWEVITANYTGGETPIDATVVQIHPTGCSSCASTPTPTPTSTPTPVPATDTPTPTPTPIPATDTPTPTPVPTQNLEVRECGTTSPYYYVRTVGSNGYANGFYLKFTSAGGTFNGTRLWEITNNAYTGTIDADVTVTQVGYSGCPTSTPTPTPTATPVPATDTPTPTPTPVRYYYQLTSCDGNTNNSLYGYSLTPRSSGFTVSYFSNIYTYYDVDPFNLGDIDLDSLSTASCSTPTPTPIPATDTPTPVPNTNTPTPVPNTNTPTPTPSPQSYIVENSDGSQYEYIGLNTGFTTNDLVTIVGYGTECWTVGGESTVAPTVTVNGACATPTPTPTPSPTPTGCSQISTTLGYSNVDSTTACNASTAIYFGDNAQFANTTMLYTAKNSNCSAIAQAGYYSDGSNWRYWNGAAFTTSGQCNSY